MGEDPQNVSGETVPQDGSPRHSTDDEPRLLPGHTADCFGCGDQNVAGLHLQVWRVRNTIYTDVVFDERHIGGPGLAHGGVIAAACDELLGFTVWLIGAPAVTRALTIEYLAPTRLHETYRIAAKIAEHKGRAVHVVAEGRTAGEAPSFTAKGVYVKVPLEHFENYGPLATPAGELTDKLAQESGRT